MTQQTGPSRIPFFYLLYQERETRDTRDRKGRDLRTWYPFKRGPSLPPAHRIYNKRGYELSVLVLVNLHSFEWIW